MIFDLNNFKKLEKKTDVVIIGSGPSGLLTASILEKKGFKIILLESGSFQSNSTTDKLNKVVCKKSSYDGATLGRTRCLGGTSSIWGGGMRPNLSADLLNGNWSVDSAFLKKNIRHLESICGLNNDCYEDPKLFSKNTDFIARYTKYSSFYKKNFFNIFQKLLKKSDNLNVYINATATKFEVKKKKLHTVEAQSRNGSVIKIKANNFIIAAGAIESTRLTLLIDSQNNNCISKLSPFVGKYFSDHISIPIASISAYHKKKLNEIFAYSFYSGKRKKIVIEMKENSTLRSMLPPFFFHIPTDSKNSLFLALREILRSVQKKNFPKFKHLKKLFFEFPHFLQLIYWIVVKKRLLFSKELKLKIHIIMQQSSTAQNKITLSKKLDSFKQPLAEIHWKVSKLDTQNILKASKAIKHFWQSSFLSSLGKYRELNKNLIAGYAKKSRGIYHPSGSTRIGATAKEGVVNNKLQLFALKNTTIVSTSVFPTGCASNPTMTLLQLVYRCAKYF
jgi:choline dehydrogenase-like flavoprotein